MPFRPAIRASASASASGCAACRTSVLRLVLTPHLHVPAPCRAFATTISRTLPPRSPSTSSPFSFLLPRPAFSRRPSTFYSTETTPNHEDAEKSDPNDWKETDTEDSLEAEIRQEAILRNQGKRPWPQEPERDGVPAAGHEAQSESTDDKPWYLQEEAPRHPTLVPELQPLPDIPANTPAILADLVKCLAEDMGLDNLNLLDLRALDPPAALGPSLIMLFGSARSERHLHISAGRLKSWLRKRGFNVQADGLMGRKDFKVQMRRRHRRAKLLGTTPSPAESGLATRWVCMNLGTIGYEATDEMPFSSNDGTFTGFGVRQTGGTTIVLQLFTESKREDMGLEGLWSRILARRENNLLVQDDLEYSEAGADPNEVALFTEGGSPKVLTRPSQRRFFSTSSRLCAPPHDFTQVTSPSHPASTSSTVDISLDPIRDLATKVAELEQLRVSFSGLPYAQAVEAIPSAEGSYQSAWAAQWNGAIRHLAPEQSWRFRLWLFVAGRKLGLQTYCLGVLSELVREMELLGIICQRSQYVELLQSVYLEPAASDTPLDKQSLLALDILRVMFERGEPIMATDVTVSLLESLTRTESPSEQKRELQKILEHFIYQVDLPYMGEAAVVRLLDAYASQDNWERWWQVWRMAPQHGLPRSERLYTHMWATVAASQHQKRCRDALRTYYVEMVNEQPVVKPTGAVKDALEACLRVAEPGAEEVARDLIVHDYRTKNLAEAEFVHMWRMLNPQWVTGTS